MEWFGCKLAQRECLALFGKFDKDGSGRYAVPAPGFSYPLPLGVPVRTGNNER